MKKLKKENYDIVAIVHRIWTDGKRKKGGLDKVIDYLIDNGKSVLLIEHPLRGLQEQRDISDFKTRVTAFSNGAANEIFCADISKSSNIKTWIKEVSFNRHLIRKNVRNKSALFVSDPLNALTGICSPLLFRSKYFHCVDFSTSRFSNRMLNLVYSSIYQISFKTFTLFGVVSLQTKQALADRGCSKQKIMYVPNSPIFKEYDLSKKEPFTLICTGGAVISKYSYEYILDILFLIKNKFPAVKLYIVGGLLEDRDYVEKLKRKINNLGMEKNIKFTGFLVGAQLSDLLKKITIGLCFYAPEVWYYTKYGDSLKMREYALFGIPTVSDGNSATDIEMVKAGAGNIAKDESEAAEIIGKFFADDELYFTYQKKCLAWAKDRDKLAMIVKLGQKLKLDIT